MKRVMIGYMQNKKHDHFDTPAYAVEPLLNYIPRGSVIWEPTDTTGKSQITKVFRKYGCKVISTSQKKFDFLKDTPDFYYDYIITNPPYSLKDEFIMRCTTLADMADAGWAMLMPLTALEGIWRGKLYRAMPEGSFGLLVLDRRVEFTGGSVWFNTSWFCYDILPQQLMFAQLEKK